MKFVTFKMCHNKYNPLPKVFKHLYNLMNINAILFSNCFAKVCHEICHVQSVLTHLGKSINLLAIL